MSLELLMARWDTIWGKKRGKGFLYVVTLLTELRLRRRRLTTMTR